MGRIFNNTAGNYMKRATVNIGLNTLTEMSFAIWIKLKSRSGATQRIMVKEHSGGNAAPSRMNYDNAGLAIGALDRTLVQTPDWIFAPFEINQAVRVLFTFKRNAINASDGIMYYNGAVQPVKTFTANSYGAGFTLSENSNNLYYGIRQTTLVDPVDGLMAWATWWNRQLTPAEVLTDLADPKAVTSGRVSCVEFCSDDDLSLGGAMTVNGTLGCRQLPPEFSQGDAEGDSFQITQAA